ncbi:retropepsin-like aspartic protease family protein [Neptuniibacter marinus]|uniref:retropepsin-like aspartic protease family protein n=1 Tax=Neptuniibacter marinus TaxID=1806670 RepID=UPI00082F61F2|nr:TIGR02281 family clan AA aspartic protease [Neptuniibacter marinus]
MTQQHTPKRIGQGMWMIAWVLLLGLLYLFFEDTISQQYNPNQSLVSDSSNTEVVLQRNRSGHYVAPGKINGTTVTFLLDTGATTISIPEAVAEKIGLTRGFRSEVSTANGNISVYNSTLDSVQLGGIKLYDIRGHINPYMDGETVLLGMSFMKHLEITQKGNTLTLRR